MNQIVPYLFFNGNCREAMTFYKECLGGELNIQTAGENPAAQFPPEEKDKVLHAALQLGEQNFLLMASDRFGADQLGKDEHRAGNDIALSISCSGSAEIERLFTGLSSGGKVTQPLAEMFWGATYGQLIDRFGIAWMLNYAKNR